MRKTKLLIATAIMSLTMSFASFAGQWESDSNGWRYQNDDGSYTISSWQTIDGKSYYFDESGYMLVNTTTPDGYYVGSDGTVSESTTTATTSEYDSSSYQSILNEYTEKIKAAIPTLIAEYKAEAANNTNGLTGLVEIAKSKISKLAEIEAEGIGKLADLYSNTDSGKYSEYEEWAKKLFEVYSAEAQKILDACKNSI